jgi:hypothetical protein
VTLAVARVVARAVAVAVPVALADGGGGVAWW